MRRWPVRRSMEPPELQPRRQVDECQELPWDVLQRACPVGRADLTDRGGLGRHHPDRRHVRRRLRRQRQPPAAPRSPVACHRSAPPPVRAGDRLDRIGVAVEAAQPPTARDTPPSHGRVEIGVEIGVDGGHAVEQRKCRLVVAALDRTQRVQPEPAAGQSQRRRIPAPTAIGRRTNRARMTNPLICKIKPAALRPAGGRRAAVRSTVLCDVLPWTRQPCTPARSEGAGMRPDESRTGA